MKLVAGLGNPGRRYHNTRHNIGFMAVEALARRWQVSVASRKWDGTYVKTLYRNEEVVLVEPQTFMNESGLCIAAYLNYFKLALANLLVIHDDLDFPFGVMRLAHHAGAAGHRGVESIVQHATSQEFDRLRLGIGRPVQQDPIAYVLSPWSASESERLGGWLTRVCEAAELWIEAGAAAVMQQFHGEDKNGGATRI